MCIAAALTWVVYDVFLSLDREAPSWTLSKVLFLFSRYHTILALGSIASRWYLGLTEVFSILAGELLILLRINAVYGWSRKIVVFTLFLFCGEDHHLNIGLVTTILSLRGGENGLLGSKHILSCTPDQENVPDVNVASIYLGLVINKAIGAIAVVEAVEERKGTAFHAVFSSSRTIPTLHLSLYFILIFGVLLLNLVLIVSRNRYAQLGTAWLLATYSVASTRIFLNLKDITRQYSEATWSGPWLARLRRHRIFAAGGQ
ncbi:hypothetical protein B0H13DRAFT_2230624 [Mycena leptocephala]|nr:hypothetical protein B0H13DRAFT_2230624 [Mycena leptocephala]